MENPIEYLIYWANQHPEKNAIQNTVSQFTYSELVDRVCKIAGKLKALGVRPQQTVLLSMAEDHFRWIFSLALMHVGVILVGKENLNDVSLNDGIEYDWVISDRTTTKISEDQQIIIDRPWLLDIKNLDADVNFFHYKKNDPICIFSTSGTTGTKKKVCWNFFHLEERAKSEKSNTGCEEKLTLMDSTSNLGFYVGFSSFVFGETLFTQGSTDEVIELLQKFGIKTLHGSPAQIGWVLDEIIKHDKNDLFGKVDKVITAGSVISDSLLTNIRQYLGSSVYTDFGSTETGLSCQNSIESSADLNSIGSPASGVLVQIVDDEGKSVLDGEVGKIRIKTPYMVPSYLNNAEASATFFKDGWFYSGDQGFLNDQNKICLVGRDSEVINLGGVKVNQFLIDMFFLKYPGIRDAAVFTYQNPTGLDELCVAIVSDDALNIDLLKEKLIREVGLSLCPKRFFRAMNIPRNSNGKVSRDRLANDILNLNQKI